MFPHFTPSGTTPEGLTFETIMNELVGGSGNVDSYFLNMSDGMPYVSGVYEGQWARKHTQKQVQNMRGRGIKVLSYLISDTSYYMTEFREMYGTSAKSIDVESITQIARTMNEMFLSKD
jgi:nitric oxide reductase activation protein